MSSQRGLLRGGFCTRPYDELLANRCRPVFELACFAFLRIADELGPGTASLSTYAALRCLFLAHGTSQNVRGVFARFCFSRVARYCALIYRLIIIVVILCWTVDSYAFVRKEDVEKNDRPWYRSKSKDSRRNLGRVCQGTNIVRSLSREITGNLLKINANARIRR